MRRCKKIDIFPCVLCCPLFLHRLMSCGPWPLRPVVRGAGIADTFSASTEPGWPCGKDVPGRPHLSRGRQRTVLGQFCRPKLLKEKTHAGGSVTTRRPVRPFVLNKSRTGPGAVAAYLLGKCMSSGRSRRPSGSVTLFRGAGPGLRRCGKVEDFPFVLMCSPFPQRLMSCGPLRVVRKSSVFGGENSEPQRASSSEKTAKAIISCGRRSLLSQFSPQAVSSRSLRAPARSPATRTTQK